jgi:hypothetical protein
MEETVQRTSTSPVHKNTFTPHCFGMEELPEVGPARAELTQLLATQSNLGALHLHLSQGLALTAGSALGERCPSAENCLAAFVLPNSVGLTAGARAWSKHAHRGGSGWWGLPHGPVAQINQKALALFHRVMDNATWRNLHWLPHQILVYEVRVAEGYGIRFAQDRTNMDADAYMDIEVHQPWIFRGFLEPQINNGHEVGWRHNL